MGTSTSMLSHGSFLGVDVAKRTSKGAHGFTLGDVGELSLKHLSKRHCVVEGTVAAGRKVQECNGVGDGILAILDILVLPDPPDAVNLSVMNWNRSAVTSTEGRQYSQ